MHLLVIFASAFIIGLSGAMMPGPVTAVVAEQSMKRGFIAGPLIVLGHASLEILVIFLLLQGLGNLIGSDIVSGIIGFTGGLILFYMGSVMIKNALKGRISLNSVTKGKDNKKGPFFAGIITTLSNPYWFIWWVTIGAGYVLFAMEYGNTGIIVFFTGHLLSDLLWFSLLSIIFVSGRKLLTDRIYAGIVFFLGIFLLFFGGYFFISGMNLLKG